MADSDIKKIWNDAIELYRIKTGKSLDGAMPKMPDRFNIDAVLTQVEQDNKDYQKFKDSRKALDDVLKPVLHVVGELAETVGEAVALAYPPAKAISVAVCWLVAVGKNYADKYDTIIEVFSHLRRALGRLRIHSAHAFTTEIRSSMAHTLGHILGLLGTARKALEEPRLKQIFKIAAGRSDKLREALAELQNLTSQETSVVSAETLSVVNTVLEKLNRGMNAELCVLLEHLSIDIKAVRDEQFLTWLKSWLNAPDASYNHERNLDSRQDGTGAWFLQGSEFTRWKEVSGSIMWMKGSPGCGKSVLCSSAIDIVASHCSNVSSSTYLYFYFDFNDADKQTYKGLLRWLLLQLAGSCDGVPPPLVRLRETSKNGVQQPNSKALAKTIQELCSLFRDVYLILDALDECNTEELRFVLDFCVNLGNGDRFSLHTLVTSRPELDKVNRLNSLETRLPVSIVLAQDIIQDDIELYIKEKVSKEPRFNGYGHTLCHEIQKHLSEKASGMFRWVALQIDHLLTCDTIADIEDALKELPETLIDTYARILGSLEGKNVSFVAMMLPYLVHSKGLLTVDELAAAAAVRLNDQDPLNPKNRFRDPETALKLLSGLVTFFRRPESDGDTATYVQLAHSSVLEYLVSDAASQYSARFNVQFAPAHYLIFRTSLLVLNSLDEPNMTREESMKRQPLAMHAAEFWPHHFHCSSCSLQNDSEAWLQLKTLFDHTKHCFQNWITCYDHDNFVYNEDLSKDDIPDLPIEFARVTAADPLYYAAALGVYDACVMIIGAGVDVNDKPARRACPSALGAACCQGHSQVVQFLLKSSADPNIPGGEYGSALGMACCQGHAEVVQLLLDFGAHVNSINGKYGSALGMACHYGHAAIVQLLLDRGPDVNIPGGEHGSALGAACNVGQAELVRLLLDSGANLNIGLALKKIPGGYPIRIACYWGHQTTFSLLLDRGADLNISGGRHGSALGVASAQGRAEMVNVLLDHGADVNIPGGHYGSPLGAACCGAHPNIVQLLLARGADISLFGVPCLTAVRAALLEGSAWAAEHQERLDGTYGMDFGTETRSMDKVEASWRAIEQILSSRIEHAH